MGRLLYEYRLVPVRKIRLKRLQQMLLKSPYYQNVLGESMDLSAAPLMNKSLFMQHFKEINTLGLDKEPCMELALKAENTRDFSPTIQGISVGLSTGTSGNRGLFLVSPKERAIWVATILDRVIGFSLRKRKVAFFLRANNNLYQSTQSKLLQFNFFDILMPIENHVKKLKELQPDIIVAQPSVLYMIAEAIQQNQLNLSPRKVISVAEVLTPEDRKYFENAFQQPIHQVYQCTEGFLAATCKMGTLHFNEDFIQIEKKYIDAERTKFHPVITDLLRTSQPVVRFELNDIINEKQSCACGSRMMAIESIEGRSDDLLIFTNRYGNSIQIFPDLFRRIIVLSDERISDYCLIQTAPKLLQLYIKSTSTKSVELAKMNILNALLEHGIEDVSIEELESFPTMAGTKKRRVRNDTTKTNKDSSIRQIFAGKN
jgi:putative adenylate-forming enzyme